MVDSPRRYIPARIKGDRWRNQTVQGHIAHPPRQQYQSQTVQGHITHPLRQQYHSQSVHGHISTPVTTRSKISQQRKRHQDPSPQSGRSRRRRVEADSPTPAQSLIDNYNKRKAATTRFPPKITPLHIRAAMRRYEELVQDAYADVESLWQRLDRS